MIAMFNFILENAKRFIPIKNLFFKNKILKHKNKPQVVSLESKSIIYGEEVTNNFQWIKDNRKKALDYIRVENSYTDAFFSKRKRRIKAIKNVLEKLQKNLTSLPVSEVYKGYSYFYQEDGGLYKQKIQCPNQVYPIEVVINEKSLTIDFMSIGQIKVSPSHQYVAMLVDVDGNGYFDCHINQLRHNQSKTIHIIENVTSLEWMSDLKFCYTTKDRRVNRIDKAFISSVDNFNKNSLIHHECDSKYSLHLSKSKSECYIFINVTSKVNCEVLALDCEDLKLHVLWKRSLNKEAYIDHLCDIFYNLTTNTEGEYCIRVLLDANLNSSLQWTMLHERNCGNVIEDFIQDVEVLKDKLVAVHTSNLIPYIYLKDLNRHEKITKIQPFTTSGVLEYISNDQVCLNFTFTSPIQPLNEYAYDISSNQLKQVSCETPIWNSEDYTFTMCYSQSHDGTEVPISVYHKKDIDLQSSKMLCCVYGSYGVPVSLRFNQLHGYLLSIGWIISYCHVRGGNELGRNWYYTACKEKKEKTFDDFESCLDHLHTAGYSDRFNTSLHGKSAGGLPIAVLLNRRPDLVASAVLQVPFLSVLDTMLDGTSPLVSQEYQDFGNPLNNAEDFNSIRGYCPYHNMRMSKTPVFVIVSTDDDRVPYWIPLQWVAKRRYIEATSGTDTMILARIHETGGHQHLSYDSTLQQDAEIITFLEAHGRQQVT